MHTQVSFEGPHGNQTHFLKNNSKDSEVPRVPWRTAQSQELDFFIVCLEMTIEQPQARTDVQYNNHV